MVLLLNQIVAVCLCCKILMTICMCVQLLQFAMVVVDDIMLMTLVLPYHKRLTPATFIMNYFFYGNIPEIRKEDTSKHKVLKTPFYSESGF